MKNGANQETGKQDQRPKLPLKPEEKTESTNKYYCADRRGIPHMGKTPEEAQQKAREANQE